MAEALVNYLSQNLEYFSKDGYYNEIFGDILCQLSNVKFTDKYGSISLSCNIRMSRLYKIYNPNCVIKITEEEWKIDLEKYVKNGDYNTFITKLSQIVLDNDEKLSSVRFIFPKCLSIGQRQCIHIMQKRGQYLSFTPIYKIENEFQRRLNIFKTF
jgi:hypothetical protein